MIRRKGVPAHMRPRPYHPTAVLRQTRRYGEVHTHGFRSTIVAWGVAVTHRGREPFSLELMDRVLSHTIQAKDSAVSAALPSYLGDADPFLGRRKVVMREWSAFLRSKPQKPAKAVQSPAAAAPALLLVA